MPSLPNRLAVPLAIALLCLVWSSTWYGIRICLDEQPPLTSAALRFLIAGLVMSLAAPVLRARENAPSPPAWLWLAAGATVFAGSYGVLYWAEQVVPSGIAAVLWGIFPLLMAASGYLFLGESLRPRKALGVLIAFVGIVIVNSGNLGGIASEKAHYAWLLLLSPVVSAIGTTLIKRFGSGTSSVLLNRNGMLVGAALLGLAAGLVEEPGRATWSVRGLLALLYLSVFGTAMSFGIYFWLLRTTPASRLALITYVTPVLAMLLGAVVGDGQMDGRAWLGTVAVVLGVGLVVSTPRASGRIGPVR